MRAEVVDGDRAPARSRPRSAPSGRNRVLLNRHPLARDAATCSSCMRVTVFAPDDLAAGEGRPGRAARRTSTTCSWRSRRATRRPGPTTSGCCKQRNALLQGRRPRRRRGAHPRRVRRPARARPAPSSCGAGCGCSSGWCPRSPRRTTSSPATAAPVDARRYEAEWAERPSAARIADAVDDALRDALARRRPRRDRPRAHAGRARTATSGGCASAGSTRRTHASQGEQRTLALALRLGGHRLCAETHRQRAGAAARRRVQRARRPARRRAGRAPRRRARRW